jgi:hypothetical protein
MLTAVGALLRVYRLNDQSVWLDEFLSVANLRSDTPGQMLDFIQLYFPEHAASPVFYIMLYYWSAVFGEQLVALRALPVVIGTLSIPLVYCFATRFWGHRVAMVAALFYTFSPQHIWHSQELRQYCLSVPLALLAMNAMLRAFETNSSRWWTANLVVNMLLVWSHTLNAFALIPQGLFILWTYRKKFLVSAKWTLAHFLMLTPVLYVIASGPYRYRLPGGPQLIDMLSLILFDDIVSFNEDLIPPFKTNELEALSHLARTLLNMQPFLDKIFVLVILGVSMYAGLSLILRHCRSAKLSHVGANSDIRETATLLVALFLIVPDLALVGVGWFFELQLAGSMYAIYATVSLYIFLGLAFERTPISFMRPLFLLSCMILLVFQLLLLLPEKSRSDWLGVARHLNEHAGVEDAIVDIQFFGPASYLPYNGLKPSLSTSRVWTLEAAVDEVAAHLAVLEDGSRSNETRCAWIAYERHLLEMRWPDGPYNILHALNARDLSGHRIRFPGHYNAELIRVERQPDIMPEGGSLPVAQLDEQIDYRRLLGELGVNAEDEDVAERHLRSLRMHIPIWPPVTPFFVFFQAMWVLAEGDIEVANALVDWTLESEPGFGLAHFGKGLLQAVSDKQVAATSFETSFDLHTGIDNLFGTYVKSLLYSDDCAQCLREVDVLETKGYVAFSDALRAACRMQSDEFGSDSSK